MCNTLSVTMLLLVNYLPVCLFYLSTGHVFLGMFVSFSMPLSLFRSHAGSRSEPAKTTVPLALMPCRVTTATQELYGTVEPGGDEREG